MLRILNGGVEASPLLDPARLAMVTGVRPEQYPDFAALRGDASDNLPGVAGFGAKTAVKLLARLGHRRGGVRGRPRRGGTLHGGDRRGPGAHARHRRGPGALRPQPRGDGDGDHRRARPRPGGGGLLPLDEDAVRTTFARFELHVPPPSGR